MAASPKVKNLEIVPLQESHISAILEIEKLSNGAPWSERSFRNELTNPQSTFLVALIGGEVVGYAGFWTIVDEAHITTVAIHPDHRRMGLGRRLVRELLERAKAAGIQCVTLEVRRGNEAATKLYLQMGFQEVAIRRGYYPDNGEDAVVMWLYDLPIWTS